jgi:hypothetical protein
VIPVTDYSMRKALVNDVVHSFCYAARQAPAEGSSSVPWPNVLLGKHPLLTTKIVHMGYFDPRRLIPFVAYAYAANRWPWAATNNILTLSDCMRRFTVKEQDYAIYLMERYYGCKREASSNPDQFELFGDFRQGVPEASTISKRH